MENITEQMSAAADAARENVQEYITQGEEYVRANPTRSLLVALGGGFLLAQLPLRYMVVAFVKLILLLVKPATFIYAISKLIDDVRATRLEE